MFSITVPFNVSKWPVEGNLVKATLIPIKKCTVLFSGLLKVLEQVKSVYVSRKMERSIVFWLMQVNKDLFLMH